MVQILLEILIRLLKFLNYRYYNFRYFRSNILSITNRSNSGRHLGNTDTKAQRLSLCDWWRVSCRFSWRPSQDVCQQVKASSDTGTNWLQQNRRNIVLLQLTTELKNKRFTGFQSTDYSVKKAVFFFSDLMFLSILTLNWTSQEAVKGRVYTANLL